MGRRGAEGAVAEEVVEEGAVEAELERCQLGREGGGGGSVTRRGNIHAMLTAGS